MTWTYDSTITTNRDKVRLLIGDVDVTNPLVSDEELCFLEGENDSSIYDTAVAAIDVAIALLARKPESKSVGPLSLSYASRIRNLEAARARIEDMVRQRTGVPTPYAGGISRSDKITNETGDDVDKEFRLGQMDAPGGLLGDDLTSINDRDRWD